MEEGYTSLEYAIALHAYCVIGSDPSQFRILTAVGKKRPEDPFIILHALVEHTLGDKVSIFDTVERPSNFLEKLLEEWAAPYPEAKTDILSYETSEQLRIEVYRTSALVPDQQAIMAAYDDIIASEET